MDVDSRGSTPRVVLLDANKFWERFVSLGCVSFFRAFSPDVIYLYSSNELTACFCGVRMGFGATSISTFRVGCSVGATICFVGAILNLYFAGVDAGFFMVCLRGKILLRFSARFRVHMMLSVY